MGIFTKKKTKETPFFTYPKDSEEDNYVDDWITKSLTHNDDGIDRDRYYPQASGSPVMPLYPVGDPTTIPIFFNGSGTYNPNGYGVITASNQPDLNMSEDLIDKLWEKMYSRPVIVRCNHCNSHNVISNPTCVQCGAPMGDYKRMKKYER